MKQMPTPSGFTSADKPRDEQLDFELDRFLSRAEVRKLIGLSSTTIWRESRAGRFPSPVTLSPNRKAFRAHDVAAWIRARVAAAEVKKPGVR